ncbi:MAG TPA: gamma-glutamyltransferase [Steroidobacteraceae bacterium]|nr:gamma-glutamyltransferase [Steroidobacteraceae bacterium]
MTRIPRGSAAVACGHEVTAAAAREALNSGGNAFDAAVASICAACVAEPVLCSLAGGGYLLAHPIGASPIVYDFFVDTPLTRRPLEEIDLRPVHADFGSVTQEFHIGMGSIATPGVVAGLFELHRDLCTLRFEQLVEPAIAAARDGVVVNELQGYIFDVVAPIYLATAAAREIYTRDGHALPKPGDRFCQPDLACTFERLAREGPALFYQGEFALRLVEASGENAGQLTMNDLARYRVERRTPMSVRYRDADVILNPPPSRGGLLIGFALALLADLSDSVRPAWLASLARVMRMTNLARAESEDPLLDAALLERYRRELHSRPGCDRGTTHISVIDGAGTVAAATLSNGEGCGHVLTGTGVMLNNMLGEEDLNPGGFQQWPPGTRMASMMAPTLLERRGTLTALGSGGSNRIRSAILQVITNLIDFGMSVEEAVCAARIHVEGDLLSIEGGFSDAEVAVLDGTGLTPERWQDRNLFFGGVHVAQRNAQGMTAVGDPRRGGVGFVIENDR